MKRLVITAIFIAVFAAGLPVFAQTIPEDRSSEYYYVNVTVEKVWPYRSGYIVQYRKGPYTYGRVFLPIDWFTNTADKGEIINLPPGNAWPSLSVYYLNGEFSHVRLYVHRWRSHQTWGNVPLNVDVDEEFRNVETINIKFK